MAKDQSEVPVAVTGKKLEPRMLNWLLVSASRTHGGTGTSVGTVKIDSGAVSMAAMVGRGSSSYV